MSIHIESFNSTKWRSLNAEVMRPEIEFAQLGAISPNSKHSVAPHVAQLNQSVNSIQNFIGHHAISTAQRQRALGNLSHFLQTKVNCATKNLSHLVVNESRHNLNLFAQQLGNPNISQEKKLAAALNLAEGLGVCNEGETLNIQECTQQLCNHQDGLASVLVNTKNHLIEQHLQQLVKHDDGLRLSPKLAKSLEIHHVQALKNHVATQWGLSVVEDRYATQSYQSQVGEMASELLKQTITPALLATTVAEQLAQSFSNLAGGDLAAGMPAEQLKTEPLRRAIQAEFGQEIGLEACLAFNDDYSVVKLKAPQEIALHVMQVFQKIGLIDQHANPKNLLNAPTPGLKQTIDKVSSLRGEVISHSVLIPMYWFGQTQLFVNDSQNKREEDEYRKKLQQQTN